MKVNKYLIIFSLIYFLVSFSGCSDAELRNLKIVFYGGAQQVGGSCYLLEFDQYKVLLDCGMNFGEGEEASEYRSNFISEKPSSLFKETSINAVIISHAHLDHLGNLALLYKNGFRGRVYATRVTKDLAVVMLEMVFRSTNFGGENFYKSIKSKRVHSRKECHWGSQIKKRNLEEINTTRTSFSGQDCGNYLCPECVSLEAQELASLITIYDYGQEFTVNPKMKVLFLDAGHLPGSAITICEFNTKNGPFRIAYSGDYGSGLHSLLNSPNHVDWAQVMLLESTYGDKTKKFGPNIYEEFYLTLSDAVKKGHRIIIPAYVLDRTQKVLQVLGEGVQLGRIPNVPVYVTSSTTEKITQLYRQFSDSEKTYHAYFSEAFFRKPLFAKLDYSHQNVGRLLYTIKCTNKKEDREKARVLLEELMEKCPSIFIVESADGKHGASNNLISRFLKDEKTTFVTVGWAPPSSPVGKLKEMAEKLNGEGSYAAQVKKFEFFSSHADQNQLTELVRRCARLQKVLIVHGMPKSIDCLSKHLKATIGGSLSVVGPQKGQHIDLIVNGTFKSES